MKKILQYCFVILIGFVFFTHNIGSGSTAPPPDAKVYVDTSTNIVYTPFKARQCSTCIPLKYGEYSKMGYTLYDLTGFNTNGPSLFIMFLHKIHFYPEPSLRWNDNNKLIEYLE